MVIYKMQCPIHNSNMMETTNLVQRKGAAKKEPLFKCEHCKKYYMYDKGADGKKIGTYGGVEVVATSQTYKLQSDAFGGSMGGSIWKGEGNKQAPSPVKKNPVDSTVRIKRVKDAEVTKAKNNLANIRNEYPMVATEKMSVFDFMLKIFGSNIDRDCVVRNASLIWKGNLVKKVEFFVRDSNYLKNKLPQGIYLLFGGKISNGEFVVDEIRVVENPDLKNGFVAQMLKFAYDGPNHTNWFYSIADKEAKPAKQLVGEIASWNDYLDWRRQLAELRIRGIKYIAFKVDLDERRMTFLTVTEGEKANKEFRKFLNRNEVSVFSNKYSKNRWMFEFNRDYQDAQDSGVDVIFVEFGEHFSDSAAIRDSQWQYVTVAARSYKEDQGQLSFSQRLAGISSNYFEPYFQELVFELTERATTLLKRDLKRFGNINSKTEDSITEEFYADGYIATSQIGDFALLSRLQRAIDDLTNGKCAQQDLDQWLFDITRADKAYEPEEITKWQNKKINDKQKLAVQKIISAPEVCLVQGPPGTGKTTVIAEAIYQLVVRNKRVLVASQANLAVDNALERLIKNPKIRAIRLGNARKIDDSVKNITEENVLETFYDSEVDYLQRIYLDKWEEQDELANKAEIECNKYSELLAKKQEVLNKIAEMDESVKQLGSNERALAQNILRSEKMSAMMLEGYCEDQVTDLELMLGTESVALLWSDIEKILIELNGNGIRLIKSGVDINNINGVKELSAANRVIKYAVKNAKVALKMKEKLQADIQFGGESNELESLKLLELDLRNKMLTDPSVISEWQKVNQEIQELSKSGLGLSDDEISLFNSIPDMEENEKRNYLLRLLTQNESVVKNFVTIVSNSAKSIVTQIDSRLAEEEHKEEEAAREISRLKIKIEKANQEKEEIDEEISYLLDKYDASPNNLRDRVDEYAATRMEKIQTKLKREDWEDIFKGFRDWVDEIPDYSQEKDIFLRDYINGCNVVGVSCTENTRTLTENGFDDFDVVIIDEVSKATPPELLIPMLRGRKIVLVGDHRQLPPLFNEHEKSYEEVAKQQENNEDVIVPLTMDDFEKYRDMVTASLFERYFESADKSIKETLTIQYRMHSDIMDLINLFYDGYLRDGNEDEYTEDTKAHYLSIYSSFGTEMIVPERHAYWFDSSQLAGERIYEQRRPQSSSCENIVEAETIVELLRKMETQYANMEKIKEPVSIGVISFYFDQVSLIRKLIKQESFHAIDVEVNTVDRFQGKEKEIIFVSLVRNVKNPKHNLDAFIAAFQRINVAFSRAQNLLVILGSTDMYAEQPVEISDMNNGEKKIIYPYKQILEKMNTQGTYFTCDEVIPEERVDEILSSIEKRRDTEE